MTTEQLVREAWASGFKRERRLTVSEWADEHRQLSGVSAREAGTWRTSRTPYLRDIMDSLSPQSPVERVVFMKGAQVGGTEAGNNWVGYQIHRNPGPMLMVLPTVEVARRVSKQRIAPMIRNSPVLRARVRESRARDSGNTLLAKEYDGGLLLMTGANSSAGLRSMPVRDLFLDEVDEYPDDVDGQGDPVELAEERTSTFEGLRKIYLPSTPTVRGTSRVEALYLERSDQRRYYIPCPSCAFMDYLTWTGRDWLGSDDGAHHRIEWEEDRPETARMVCSACGKPAEERHKTAMLRAGEWRPRLDVAGRPVGDGTAGFHLSSLYSPAGWRSWSLCVSKFLRSKNDPSRLKTWVNATLGETWEERGDSIEPHVLRRRCQIVHPGVPGWPTRGSVPHGVGVLISAVDVHPDRLELVVKGYGAAEESWLIEYSRLDGDPSELKVWGELDRQLATKFEHASGRRLPIERTVIDSGGCNTDEVYRYCKARLDRGVFAIKGSSEAGRPLVERPSTRNRYKLPLFMLCVDTGKETILNRLQIQTAGPGCIHLPDWVDDEYLEQLTAEKAIRKYVRGRGLSRVWVQKRRNEALDLEVYALAAVRIMGENFVRGLADRAAEWSRASEEPEEPGPAPPVPAPRRRPAAGGWIDSWRK